MLRADSSLASNSLLMILVLVGARMMFAIDVTWFRLSVTLPVDEPVWARARSGLVEGQNDAHIRIDALIMQLTR